MAINIAPKSLDTELSELMRDVTSGKAQLPEFQRSWTWDDGRIRGILASLSQGYPMGAIMRLECGNENVKFKYRPIERVKNVTIAPDYLILDGQQRLTSMYPPTLEEVKKDLKVPWKIGALEFFSEERKERRVAAEKKAHQELEKRKQEYSNRAAAYEKKNAEYNAAIDRRNEASASGNAREVTEFFAWVIEQDCSYIEGYYVGVQPEKYIFYNPEKRMLAVDLKLPATRRIPDIESYEYEEKKDNIKAKRMTRSDFKSFYGHIVCEIVLRVICVLFESDEYRLVDSIVVNGV